MLPDQVSNPGPLTYESGALPIVLRGPAQVVFRYLSIVKVNKYFVRGSSYVIFKFPSFFSVGVNSQSKESSLWCKYKHLTFLHSKRPFGLSKCNRVKNQPLFEEFFLAQGKRKATKLFHCVKMAEKTWRFTNTSYTKVPECRPI